MTDVLITYREAGGADVPAMAECRRSDPAGGHADERMAAYFEGRHHPQQALSPRVGYVALVDHRVVGYVAGHLTRRFQAEGELQYLFVASGFRRLGLAHGLTKRLADWFVRQEVSRVCVNVDADSPAARLFYVSLGARDMRPHWMEWPDISTVLGRPDL